MSNLFKKAAVYTDIHLGLKSNSLTHLTDCLNFTKWFIETAKKENCDICLFLGDFHNNRNTLNILTMNIGLQCMQLLNKAFDRIIMIPGNHDCFYRDNRSVHSIIWADKLSNIEVINKWHSEGDTIFVPWMVGNDHKKIASANAKYMFGHFELPNFLLNSQTRMPDVGEINSRDFIQVEKVFSGHFHIRQFRENITYIGNTFPLNYSDAWDDARGMMILEWGAEPIFKSWPDAPRYRIYTLSDIALHPEKLKPNTYARIQIDTDLTYEESNLIKETLVEKYKLREFSLIPFKEEYNGDIDIDANLSVQSVDSIVTSQITSLESDYYKTELLLKIYQDL